MKTEHMKKYTQEEFDALPIIDGIRVCPAGDYTAIKIFPNECSFGEQCSFGRDTSIAGHVLRDGMLRSVSGLGNSRRTLYVWNTYDGWFAQAGCFLGAEDDFREAVEKKYYSSHHYIAALELLKTL